jgi:hypothetical protein
MRSWRRLSDPPPGIWHRADDFVSDGRPITDIHWWGSYVGWLPETNGMREIDPIPSPTGFDRPLGFDLSWHLSDPEEFCHPGQLLTNIFVPIRKTHEVFYHSVLQFWEGPPRFEHEYQYYVDLLDLDVSGKPWFELEGTQYWLNIQAVFDDSFDPGPSHRGWGWSISPPLGLTPCPSVFMTNIVSGWEHAIMEPPHPLVGAPIDLAFELTTTQIPSNNSPWSSTIVLSNLVVDPVPPHMEVELVSHGYCPCGIQVLQQSVNLTNASAGFYDVQTNWVPRAVNTWRVPRWSSNSFYRVRETNLY